MTLQQQIRQNRVRTFLLVLLFGGLVAGLALIADLNAPPDLTLGGYRHPVAALVVVAGLLYGVYAWFASSRMVAGITRARAVDQASAPGLYHIVDTVAIAAGLAKTPEVRVVDDPAPNAFAAGRDPDHSYVAVTTGLLEVMDRREIEAVVAHEIAHIRNRDVRLMTLVVALVGVVIFLADVILRFTLYGGRRRGTHPLVVVVGVAALVLAPLAAVGIQMAVSRRREYLADASAAEITNDPEGMALALRKLMLDPRSVKDTSRSTAHLYIESPLHKASGIAAAFRGLFETHPPLEKRIAALEEAGGFELELGQAPMSASARLAAASSAHQQTAALAAGGHLVESQPRFCTQCGSTLSGAGVCQDCGLVFPPRREPAPLEAQVGVPLAADEDEDLSPPSFRHLHH